MDLGVLFLLTAEDFVGVRLSPIIKTVNLIHSMLFEVVTLLPYVSELKLRALSQIIELPMTSSQISAPKPRRNRNGSDLSLVIGFHPCFIAYLNQDL